MTVTTYIVPAKALPSNNKFGHVTDYEPHGIVLNLTQVFKYKPSLTFKPPDRPIPGKRHKRHIPITFVNATYLGVAR